MLKKTFLIKGEHRAVNPESPYEFYYLKMK